MFEVKIHRFTKSSGLMEKSLSLIDRGGVVYKEAVGLVPSLTATASLSLRLKLPNKCAVY